MTRINRIPAVSRSSGANDLSATTMPSTTSARVSQRQPKACQECTRRKMRCDKRSPCGRCTRLSKTCTRELVRITKAETVHRDELEFLTQLCKDLSSSRDVDAALVELRQRMDLLIHGPGFERTSSSPTAHVATPPRQGTHVTAEDESTDCAPAFSETAPATPVKRPGVHPDGKQSESHVSNYQTVELLAWGRHGGNCFPHVSCVCRGVRPYAEIASINANPEWPGLRRVPAVLPPGLCLPSPDEARRLVRFHLENILWHHNVFHASIFLEQCEEFWSAGTVVHTLWFPLYLSVILVSAWTALNSAHLWSGAPLDPSMPLRLFQAMVQTLYSENFCDSLSVFSIQAIVLSTRVAHNLDQSNLNATLVGAAIRIAHSLGLHKIASRTSKTPVSTSGAWFEAIEAEIGRRCWNQLVIQDYFQIPFTGTYAIHPGQYTTDLPTNCHDEDMVEQEEGVPTINSYTRSLSRIASLMPRLLDGLGPAKAPFSLVEVSKQVVSSDQALRDVIRRIPPFLLRASHSVDESYSPSWLPSARRSLALSTADKIIMIHRPILYHSFQHPAFARTRSTCLAAALTIFREYERIADEHIVPIWTHSAFCVTAAMVVGLELLFCDSHMDDESRRLRSVMADTAKRLRGRRSDMIAERGAALIDTMLGVEEELVVKVMRLSDQAEPSLKIAQRDIVNEMVRGNEIIAKFLSLSPALDHSYGVVTGGFHPELTLGDATDWFGDDGPGLFTSAEMDSFLFQ